MCNRTKATRLFYASTKRKGGVSPYCKSCYKRQQSSEISRGKRKASDLKRRYGLGWKDYTALVINQGGKCGSCKSADYPLVVDHDHRSGTVRGLLCHKCNRAIGSLGDSVEGLKAALRYLGGEV